MLISMRRLVLALLCLPGCGYRVNSFEFIAISYPAARVTAGCLDIGVGTHTASRDDAPVVMYALGNRCDAPTVVDLRSVRAWGVVATGERVSLVARDPRRELESEGDRVVLGGQRRDRVPLRAARYQAGLHRGLRRARGDRPRADRLLAVLRSSRRRCVVKRLAIALLLASSTAHADWNYRVGNEDRCPSVVVGRCGTFGSGWQPPMLRLELGPVSHRTSIDPMVGTDEDGNQTGRLLAGGALAGRGIGGRIVMGYRGYYIATDLAGSAIDQGPAVHPVANGAVMPAIVQPSDASSGWMFAMHMGLGKELTDSDG